MDPTNQSSCFTSSGGVTADFLRNGDTMTVPGLSENQKRIIARRVYRKNKLPLPQDENRQILRFSRIWAQSSTDIGKQIETKIIAKWRELWTFDGKAPDENKIKKAPQSLQVLSSHIHNILQWNPEEIQGNEDIPQNSQRHIEFYSKNKKEVRKILNRLKKSDYLPVMDQGILQYHFSKNKDSVTITTQQDLYVMRKASDPVTSEYLFLLNPDGTLFACSREDLNDAIASRNYVPFLTIKTVADYSNPYPDEELFIVENGNLGKVVSDSNPVNGRGTQLLAPEMRGKFTISIVDHRPTVALGKKIRSGLTTALFTVGKGILFPFKLLAKIVMGIGRLILWPFKKIGAFLFAKKKSGAPIASPIVGDSLIEHSPHLKLFSNESLGKSSSEGLPNQEVSEGEEKTPGCGSQIIAQKGPFA